MTQSKRFFSRTTIFGVALSGAVALSGCGIGNLVSEVQEAARNIGEAINAENAKRSVAGAQNAVGAAFRGLGAMDMFGDVAAAPAIQALGLPASGLRPLNTEECDTGSITVTESEDGSSFELSAENCVIEGEGYRVEINGTLSFQESGSSGSLTANITLREYEDGTLVAEFAFTNFSATFQETSSGGSAELNGDLRFKDENEDVRMSYNNFSIDIRESGGSESFSIDGGFSVTDANDVACSGSWTFVTQERLVFGASDCPTAGKLEVNGNLYTFDGDTVTAGTGEGAQTFSCSELQEDNQCIYEDDDEWGDEDF